MSEERASESDQPRHDPEEEKSAAFASLTRIITRRAHGEHELIQKLRQRGYGMNAINTAMQRAQELLLLEPDSEIARRFAQELANRSGATPRSVSQRLRRRGLSPAHVKEAVSQAFDGWRPDDAAWRLVGHETNPARAARRLERRGFNTETIAKAVERLRRAKPSSS